MIETIALYIIGILAAVLGCGTTMTENMKLKAYVDILGFIVISFAVLVIAPEPSTDLATTGVNIALFVENFAGIFVAYIFGDAIGTTIGLFLKSFRF